ncbi:hypothetical protein EXIGLDRAFT_725260 [Exidia glandulosa HHB12029]|uniref:Uncharacterized protein n=1 Tax=Exidia glandulosa HHB12029 TaxID=1314781 RepID=A0A165E3T7_EXIGL|nr:hypothetical protein EXIGLDRAFT_725260 [Exidia glandulosa HHB12029]
MSTIHELPLQMLDEILMAIDDPAALTAAVLSYRRFYNIFKARKDVIKRRVLRNALGGDDVIASSLRTVRIETILPNYNQYNPVDRARFLRDIQPLKEDKTNTPTASEYAICVERARLFQQLEVLYSRSMKDRRTDKTSRLSFEESDRFRAALHRLSLLGLYTGSTSVVQVLCIRAATRVPLFYDGYSAQDVYDLHCVLDWLEELIIGCLPVEATSEFREPFRLICLCAGPAKILEAYLEPHRLRDHLRNIDASRLRSDDGWKEDLLPVFKTFQLLSPAATEIQIPYGMKPIVVLAEEQDMKCWNPTCGAQPGVQLWDATKWGYPPRWLRLDTLLRSLPDYLRNNCYERHLFCHLLGTTDAGPRTGALEHVDLGRDDLQNIEAYDVVPGMTVARGLQELCNLPSLIHDEKCKELLEHDDFSGLTSNDLLCAECLERMLKARLWLWWSYVKEKYALQEHEKESCGYGYECSRQLWNLDHASQCNLEAATEGAAKLSPEHGEPCAAELEDVDGEDATAVPNSPLVPTAMTTYILGLPAAIFQYLTYFGWTRSPSA